MLVTLGGCLLTSGVQAQQPTSYDDLVCSYQWSCAQALRIMWCESKGSPTAYSQGNYGLFQINRIHSHRVNGDLTSLYDPEINVAIAYDIYKDRLDRGLNPWQPWRACL